MNAHEMLDDCDLELWEDREARLIQIEMDRMKETYDGD